MQPIFRIDPADPMPIYVQLRRAIQAAIAGQQLRPGDQLPTVRQLAVALSINANTVARVYAELERLGHLETRRGIGTFVREGAPAGDSAVPSAEERALRALIERFLSEAAALGFSLDDVLRRLARG